MQRELETDLPSVVHFLNSLNSHVSWLWARLKLSFIQGLCVGTDVAHF